MRLRTRIAVWLGGAIVVSGIAVVLLVVVLSGRLLRERNRPEAPRPSGAILEELPGGPGRPSVGLERSRDLARKEAADATLRDVRLVGIGTVAGLAVLAAGVGWVVAGRIARPVQQVSETARSLAGDPGLTRRIAHDGPADELGELADAFNEMLDRLQGTIDAQRAFVANASHELRTPLAVMRSEVDVTLDDDAADVATLRDALVALGDEVGRMSALIDSMMWLARAEVIVDPVPVELGELVDEVLTGMSGTAVGHPVERRIETAWTRGDPVLLGRLVTNLVGNAFRHNVTDGLVAVRTASGAGGVTLVVENDGPLVEPARVGDLFERFARAQRSGEGFGVGLAIVAAIVESHHGSVEATPRPLGGLRVEVNLPS
ncbi:MAG: HAMP domain-containing sensor histidine kinase [Microthrixaceae bacterium]